MNKTPSLAPPEVMDFCANPDCATEIVDGQIAVRHGKDLYCKLSCVAKSIGAVTITAGEQKKYGVSGFLAPDGKFYACGYGKHRELAAELVVQYKVFFDGDSNKVPNFIKFGCSSWAGPEGDSACHCFMWDEPTSEQVEWLTANLDKLTGNQRRRILADLDLYDIEIPERRSPDADPTTSVPR